MRGVSRPVDSGMNSICEAIRLSGRRGRKPRDGHRMIGAAQEFIKKPPSKGDQEGSGIDMPELEKRQLGRTALQVTTLGYGAMELRGAPRGRPVSPEQADTILNAALDSGINYID